MSTAKVELINSTVIGNTTGQRGGGIVAVAVELHSSTVSGNYVRPDGGGGGGFYANSVFVYTSTVSGNSAGFDGGGIRAIRPTSSEFDGQREQRRRQGGGIERLRANLDNSTVTGNRPGAMAAVSAPSAPPRSPTRS